MHTAKFFESKPSLAQQHVTKQHTRSDWKPPQDEQVARLNRLLRQSVLDEFVPRAVKRNYTWLDCKARQWLKLHRNDLVSLQG